MAVLSIYLSIVHLQQVHGQCFKANFSKPMFRSLQPIFQCFANQTNLLTFRKLRPILQCFANYDQSFNVLQTTTNLSMFRKLRPMFRQTRICRHEQQVWVMQCFINYTYAAVSNAQAHPSYAPRDSLVYNYTHAYMYMYIHVSVTNTVNFLIWYNTYTYQLPMLGLLQDQST